MEKYRNLCNDSFQRAVVPDQRKFYQHFYRNLIAADPEIAGLFAKIDMERLVDMLIQAMTHIMTFAATLKPSEELEKIAKLHGSRKLAMSAKNYDIWLDCMVKTVAEFDPEFDGQTETSWRILMAPGLVYMKSFCDR